MKWPDASEIPEVTYPMDSNELRTHPMERLKRMLEPILDVVPPGSKVLYLDVPVHGNIGDLLILKGTEQFFREHRIRVCKRLSHLQFRERMYVPGDWIIVCHGGGNFGDLYPYYQKLRERVVESFPNHRIVILPQTVHFTNPGNAELSLALFSRHRDFHLFVRDHASFEAVKGKLPNVILAPDMAHQLFPVKSVGTATLGVLGIIRTDSEAPDTPYPDLACDRRTDWPQLLSKWDHFLIGCMARACTLDRYLWNLLPIIPLWYKIADRLVAKAVRLYSSARTIITNRLHGHLLACLMNKPNRLLDNSYGKNEGYYHQWTYRIGREGAASGESGRIDAGDLYAESS
jgi:pyruvyl transferase EpsO